MADNRQSVRQRARPLAQWLLAGEIGLLAALVLLAGGLPTAAQSPTATPTLQADGTITSNDQWTPVYETIAGIEMVRVPAGCFMMGNDPQARWWTGSEWVTGIPDGGEQCFEAFWIGRYEVTNAQYAECVAAGACTPSRLAYDAGYNALRQPISGVSWASANQYVAWLTAIASAKSAIAEGVAFRLPTEAEWEYAARGPDALFYPWGNADPTCDLMIYNDCADYPVDVGSTSPAGDSWVGAADMAGNVWEWTTTLNRLYPYVSTDGRENSADTASTRVIRGGSCEVGTLTSRSAFRPQFAMAIDYGLSDLGFRVVLAPSVLR